LTTRRSASTRSRSSPSSRSSQGICASSSGDGAREREAHRTGIGEADARGHLRSASGNACQEEPEDCRRNDNMASKPCPQCGHPQSGDQLVQTTFPRLMLEHAKQRPDAPALREKEYGIWQTTTWADLARWCAAWPAAWPPPACSAATTWW
jgi:hypothetical protein